jgi:hypothetical protein
MARAKSTAVVKDEMQNLLGGLAKDLNRRIHGGNGIRSAPIDWPRNANSESQFCAFRKSCGGSNMAQKTQKRKWTGLLVSRSRCEKP